MNGDRLSVEHRGVKLEPVLKIGFLSGGDLAYVHEGDQLVVAFYGKYIYGTVIGVEVNPACDLPFPLFTVKDEEGEIHKIDYHTNKCLVGSRDIAPAYAVHDGWVKTAILSKV